MVHVQDVLATMTENILYDENDRKVSYREQYHERIVLLYMIPVMSIMDSDNNKNLIESFIAEVIEFERSHLEISIKNINDYSEMTPENLIRFFSVLSSQLALCRLQGKMYPCMSYLMHEYYESVINEGVSDKHFHEDISEWLSEIRMDFIYACGLSDNMSLRLLERAVFLQ